MNDKIKINLQIADKNYPLTIERKDEEMVRKAAKQVNIRLNVYRTHYPTLGLKDIIGMVAYEFSLETLRLEKKNDTAPYTEKIQALAELLDEHLSNE